MANFDESTVPTDLLYTKSHEWVRVDGQTITMGITHFAQEALGDVVYVEFPEVGDELEAQEDFGVVESVKAVSDLYAPISGTVVEINEALEDNWALVNEAPYGDGWILKLEVESEDALSGLLDASAYISVLNQE